MDHLERTAGYDMDAWVGDLGDYYGTSMPVSPLGISFEGFAPILEGDKLHIWTSCSTLALKKGGRPPLWEKK